MDEIYDALIVTPDLPALSLVRAACSTSGVIDGIVNGVGRAWWWRGPARSAAIQTGFVMNYALTMLLGALAVVAFLLARSRR